jgi:hypothetical protein
MAAGVDISPGQVVASLGDSLGHGLLSLLARILDVAQVHELLNRLPGLGRVLAVVLRQENGSGQRQGEKRMAPRRPMPPP